MIKVKSGTNIFLTEPSVPVELENRDYTLNSHPVQGLYLSEFEKPSFPPKLYGEDLNYITNKVLRTFQTQNKNVGVLLKGFKGTGKSVQAKHLANNSDMPVIWVRSAFHGNALIDFLNNLRDSCVIMFDEFEKTYADRELQESILPLLDGVSKSKNIFVMTVNGEVSEFLIARPSRIRYVKTYEKLDDSIIQEITEDYLDDNTKVQEVSSFLGLLPKVNIDTVMTICEECNTFPEESINEIAQTFNIENPLSGKFNIEIPVMSLVANTDYFKDIYTDFQGFLEEKYGTHSLE